VSQPDSPYIDADTDDGACLRALRVLKTWTGRTVGGKGGVLNGEDYQRGRLDPHWSALDDG